MASHRIPPSLFCTEGVARLLVFLAEHVVATAALTSQGGIPHQTSQGKIPSTTRACLTPKRGGQNACVHPLGCSAGTPAASQPGMAHTIAPFLSKPQPAHSSTQTQHCPQQAHTDAAVSTAQHCLHGRADPVLPPHAALQPPPGLLSISS